MLKAFLTAEVPESAKNEPRSIFCLEVKSQLGRRHLFGQKAAETSRQQAVWTEDERNFRPPWVCDDDFSDRRRDRVHTGIYLWSCEGCLLLNEMLISVFAMTCSTRTDFFYLMYLVFATSCMSGLRG